MYPAYAYLQMYARFNVWNFLDFIEYVSTDIGKAREQIFFSLVLHNDDTVE